MTERPKLPVGIQTLKDIVEGGFCYVDKTALIHRLIESKGYYFLSRPRRFGKSLTIDVIKEIFEGRRELFQGLAIEPLWDWRETHPVVRISFAKGACGGPLEESEESLKSILRGEQERLGLKDIGLASHRPPGHGLEQLIVQASKAHNDAQVVLLIDEYDKPMVDYITKPEIFERNREMMRGFYGVIKDLDEHLRFCLLTGVSRFSKLNLFSGLNNLDDITLSDDTATLCGYTEEDVSRYFGDYLNARQVSRAEARRWYNGYCFGADNPEKVYNPFGFLLFLKNRCQFKAYWASTATPTFLVDTMRRRMLDTNHYIPPDLEKTEMSDAQLATFNIDRLSFEVLLFQTGYLTVGSARTDPDHGVLYRLAIPNQEIRNTINEIFTEALTGDTTSTNGASLSAREALESADFDKLQEAVNVVMAGLSWQVFGTKEQKISQLEGFYHGLMTVFLGQISGTRLSSQDSSSRGQADLSLETDSHIYVLEIKCGAGSDAPDDEVLKQILQKGYADKYRQSGKALYAVGMGFDTQKRRLAGIRARRLR